MNKVKENYRIRETAYRNLMERQSKASNRISNLRLLVFVAGVAAAVTLYTTANFILFGAVSIVFVFLFIYLIFRHQKVSDNKKYASALCKINADALSRFSDEWKSFEDTGDDFSEESHNYSGDLDIFGKGSLFQFICAANTYTGRYKLKDLLSRPAKTPGEINRRQKAVEELAPDVKWRQRLMAEGLMAADKRHDPADLIAWAEDRTGFINSGWMVIGLRLYPVVTVILALLALSGSAIPYFIPAAALAIQFALLKYNSRKRTEIFRTTAKYKDSIRAYDRILKLIEKRNFISGHLVELKSRLFNGDKLAASLQVRQLAKIVDSYSNRYNAYYFVFNLLTLWDYQCLIALERWKRKSGNGLRQWLDTIGELEALCSLSILRYDHPDWVTPGVSEGPAVFEARKMGHPLLGENRVPNDVKIESRSGVLLITGSNMSGKSTLLRTAGINLVLAYAGAPVCAGSFNCTIMDIYTCMRVSDNLQKNISSFYAELLRIKMIVKAAGEGRQIFFLLDEIFKGTNSWDRHTGARVLIKRLSRQGAVGMVSTHDLELGSLEEESSGKIKNYHFREYYKNNEIHFDYKLQPGISTTRNAIFLMKMAGIEFEEDK